MPDFQSNRPGQTLKSLFSDHRPKALARTPGFFLGQQEMKPVALFWTPVLGRGVGSARGDPGSGSGPQSLEGKHPGTVGGP